MDWTLLWKTMLVVMLGLFAVMAVITTVLGAGDIRRLMAHLRNPEEDKGDDDPPSSSSS